MLLFDWFYYDILRALYLQWLDGEDAMLLQCVFALGIAPSVSLERRQFPVFRATKSPYVAMFRTLPHRFRGDEYHALAWMTGPHACSTAFYWHWFECARIVPDYTDVRFYQSALTLPWLSDAATELHLIIDEDQMSDTMCPVPSVTSLVIANTDAMGAQMRVFPHIRWPAVQSFSWQDDCHDNNEREVSLIAFPNIRELSFSKTRKMRVRHWASAIHLTTLVLNYGARLTNLPTHALPALTTIRVVTDLALLHFACTMQAPTLTTLHVYQNTPPPGALMTLPRLRDFHVIPTHLHWIEWLHLMPQLETLYVHTPLSSHVLRAYASIRRCVICKDRRTPNYACSFPKVRDVTMFDQEIKLWMDHCPPTVEFQCRWIACDGTFVHYCRKDGLLVKC